MGCSSSTATEVREIQPGKAGAPTQAKNKPAQKPTEAWASPVPVPGAVAVEDDAGGVELPKEWTQKGQPSTPSAASTKKAGKSSGQHGIFGWFWSKSGDSSSKQSKKAAAPAAAEAAVNAVAEVDQRPARPFTQKPSVGTWLMRAPPVLAPLDS
mmetsp:Transcript_80242/g.232990  ORF Transcript_80242/g.232990 Transcript_80242/m.232990 type:complete len:154 (-) Transcript_80242:137-598(-)